MIRRLFHIAVLLICLGAQAQRKQYVFTRISVNQGLASDYVYSMLQDKQGFMWLGTANGLQRYDGRKIISFRPHPSDTMFLPAEPISQLMLDKKGRFWVRMARQIGLFNVATFEYNPVPIDIPRQDLERSELRMWEDAEGNIFITISAFGIVIYDDKTRSFIRDSTIIDAPRDGYIAMLHQDPFDGNYWIGSSKGLSLFNRKDKKLYDHNNNPIGHPLLATKVAAQPVTTLFIDRQQRAWIGNWLTQQNAEEFSIYNFKQNRLISPISLEPESRNYYREVHRFTQVNNNSIWGYGQGILAQYNEATGKLDVLYNEHPDEVGIRYDAVHSFYEDREHNIWLGTDRGIYIFNPSAQKFSSSTLLETNMQLTTRSPSYVSFNQLESGEIVATTWGNGLFVYDEQFRLKPNRFTKGVPDDANYRMIWNTLEQSSTKKIWMGCQAGRLMIYDPAIDKTTYLNLPIFDVKTIRTIAEDHAGNLWFGTQHGRLVKWTPKKGNKKLEDGFELIHSFNSHIFFIKVDEDGLLWIGTDKDGLVVMDSNGNIINTYTDKGAPGKTLYRNSVSNLLFYNDSLVIAGATVLNFLDKKTGDIRHITTEDGLPGNSVSTIQRDEDGNLWIGLINGLCRYNMKKNIFTQFSQKDGIVRNEFNNGRSYHLRDGRLIFSNSDDFIYFNPRQILSSSAPPDVSITDFKLFNTYLPPDSILQLDKVTLDHNQNSITIEFAALSFLQKDKMVYYYKMEGIDDEWMRVDRYTIANFSLMPPGEYTFKVRCENGDGIPSKNITSFKIYIRPPFWRQEWFIMLAILALAGLIYLAHRMRVRQLMQMEKVRGRIARDLHDDMGSTLSTINILSEMAKMKVNKDTEKTREYISKISDNSNRMMEAMDDIVWSINPMNDSMQRITARMREFATSVLEAKNIEVSFRVDEKVNDLRLGMESRRDFFLIFKEAINNVAKYSQGTHALVDISVNGSKLIMLIKDDGVGFDVEQADSGNGLTNMEKRAQSLGGRLLIESLPGVGSKVRLEAPLT